MQSACLRVLANVPNVFGLLAGNRRPQTCYFEKTTCDCVEAMQPKTTAEEKNRVCIAKQIPHVWLDQIGVFNTCYWECMFSRAWPEWYLPDLCD